MRPLHVKKRPTKPLDGIKRKAVEMSQAARVKLGYFPSGSRIPLVIEPAVDGVNLLAWAVGHQAYIDDLLWQHNALLFRGFGVHTVEAFEAFVRLTSAGEPLDYRDRSTPRTTKGNRIYTSTIHPADQRINPHNEGTYWLRWALKLYFCCIKAADQGGETPLVDVRNVYRRLDPAIRARFQEKHMMLTRNYNDGFGLPWQDVYQTEDKAVVESYCREHAIAYEWKEGDRLRTHQIRPAIRRHPKTRELVWFNHVAFFHDTTLEPSLRESLLAEFAIDGLPYNTYYGDGSAIEADVVEHIRQAYAAEKVMFPWRKGDVLLLDNMSIAHAREPYVGDREIVVSMTEAYAGTES